MQYLDLEMFFRNAYYIILTWQPRVWFKVMLRWSSILGLKPPDMAVMLIDKTIQIFSRKKRKREEDNAYVLVNKHGHCDVHVLLYIPRAKW